MTIPPSPCHTDPERVLFLIFHSNVHTCIIYSNKKNDYLKDDGEGVMSKFNNFRSKLADELEIPNNALSDNFELRMHGNKKVIIENHLGIKVYDENMVCIKTNDQDITIKGSKFKIEEINNYKVIVKGNIKEIIFSMKE